MNTPECCEKCKDKLGGNPDLGYTPQCTFHGNCGCHTPDTECLCGKGNPTKSKALNVQEPATHSPLGCKSLTPDTEIEDYRIFTSRMCEIAEEHSAGWKLMIENAVKNRDSSRDTYWKERVVEAEAEVRREHANEVIRILNLHSKPIADGGLDYVKAFEEMEEYEHRLTARQIEGY